MHPSKKIVGSRGRELENLRILLCICGSVAASEAPRLARELMRRGAQVRCAMTEKALEMVSTQLMHWATGEEVICGMSGHLEHLRLADWSDIIVVAPATANTIGKIANGICDNVVTATVCAALGLEKRLVIVPSMAESMLRNPFVQENLRRLEEGGLHVLRPKIEEGKAKIPGPEEIADYVASLLRPRDLQGKRIIVTAGPTHEPIDDVKFISNASSGKMGVELAREARDRGARVVLIYGPGTEKPPENVEVIRVRTTEEMARAAREGMLKGADAVIFAAAPQDLKPERRAEKKLRADQEYQLKLVPAPRVSAGARELLPNAVLVAFKAEYRVTDSQLLEAGRAKLQEGFDIVVANDVGREGVGFASDENEVLIITPTGYRKERGSKRYLARLIIDEIAKRK